MSHADDLRGDTEGERLLESVLAGEAVDPSAEAAELRRFLGRARDDLRRAPEWSRLREGALVGRVLARTTREDLSWRGELLLFAGFVRQRLAASRALRIVAASLLIHLFALPILALFDGDDSAKKLLLTFQPREETEEDARFSEPEPAAEADARTTPDLVSAARVDDALRRARFVLSTRHGPWLEPGRGRLEIELLAARSRGLSDRRWGGWLDDGSRLEEASLFATLLWGEVLLDRYVLLGERCPLLGPLLNRVALAASTTPESLAPLSAALLLRARAYDLWESRPGFDPRSAPTPLGDVWFTDLEAALVEADLAEDPRARLWLDWRP